MKRWIPELVDAKSKIGAIVVAIAVMTHLFIIGGRRRADQAPESWTSAGWESTSDSGGGFT